MALFGPGRIPGTKNDIFHEKCHFPPKMSFSTENHIFHTGSHFPQKIHIFRPKSHFPDFPHSGRLKVTPRVAGTAYRGRRSEARGASAPPLYVEITFGAPPRNRVGRSGRGEVGSPKTMLSGVPSPFHGRSLEWFCSAPLPIRSLIQTVQKSWQTGRFGGVEKIIGRPKSRVRLQNRAGKSGRLLMDYS